MAMKHCPVCGEKYSDTYCRCPFCEEEEILRSGAQSRRRGGHRAQQGGPSILSGILIIAILVMAAVLIYLLFGDAIAEKLGMGKVDPPPAVSSEVVSSGQGSAATSGEEDPAASSGEEPDEPDDPAVMDFETANALPKGLSLNTEDFSISAGDPDVSLKVTGGSGSYTWISQNPAIAEVSDSGVVKAVSGGTVKVLVTDGSIKGECIVRVKGGTQPSNPTEPNAPSSGSLKTGSATVINAPSGVNVRSGPGTENSAVASLVNGNSVTILESTGNGWYKIQFAGNGGVSTTGYVKGEFLRN